MDLHREIKVAVVLAGSGGILQVVWGKKARKRAEKLAARANLRQATHRAGVVDGVLMIPKDQPAPMPPAHVGGAQETIECDGGFQPDYTTPCEVCGQTPTVTGVNGGKVVMRTGLCGPCTWGEAETIDPATW